MSWTSSNPARAFMISGVSEGCRQRKCLSRRSILGLLRSRVGLERGTFGVKGSRSAFVAGGDRGRDGCRVARRDRAAAGAGRADRVAGGVLGRRRRGPPPRRRARPGPGAGRCGGDARRRRRGDRRHRRAGRSAGPARAGRLAGDGVAGAGRHRRPAPGRAAGGPGGGAGAGLAGAGRADRPDAAAGARRRAGPGLRGAGHRRHPDRGALREGAGVPALQGRVRDPPDPVLPGQHQRGAGRDPAHRTRRHRTPPPTTSPSWTRRSGSCPRRPGPGGSWSAPTAPGSPTPSSTTCVAQGLEYSVGYAVTDDVRDAIALLPQWAWTPAVDADGGLRDGAEVAELTEVLREARRLAAARRRRDRAKKAQASGQNGQKVRAERDKPPHWPDGMRVLVRRERPHPGAQLDAFEERDGWRYQAIATNTRVGQLAFLEARHRAHARVEDRIRQAQDAGLGRLPSKLFAINQVWLELALTAADLLAWTQTILLHRRPRAGQGRVEDDPLPAPAHRRPHRPHRPPDLATAAAVLALGPRPGPRLRGPTPPPRPGRRLTTGPPAAVRAERDPPTRTRLPAHGAADHPRRPQQARPT